MVNISKSVFRGASEISTWPNIIHPVDNNARWNITYLQNVHLYVDNPKLHMTLNEESLHQIMSSIQNFVIDIKSQWRLACH